MNQEPEHGRSAPSIEGDWLMRVAEAASQAAGGTPVELLGNYLPMLLELARTRRRPRDSELEAVRVLGRRAAELDVSASNVVQLYLSATWRLWRQLPDVLDSRDSETVRASAETFLRAITDAVVTLTEGHTQVRRQHVRWEETLRRELVDDLLRGDADVGSLVQRAEPFGLDLTRNHQVALATSFHRSSEDEATTDALERAILHAFGDRDVLVATKEQLLVVLVPATAATAPPDVGYDLGTFIHAEPKHPSHDRAWQIATGRPHAGAYGIARSYEEAREALTMAQRLNWQSSILRAEDLLIYRVLVRDQSAIADLVQAVLGPLRHARGGAEPLLTTLEAYFATGGVTTETARRLHLSVRAVTYRLARVADLTGHDPADPAHTFTLHATVLAARLLDWPHQELLDGTE